MSDANRVAAEALRKRLATGGALPRPAPPPAASSASSDSRATTSEPRPSDAARFDALAAGRGQQRSVVDVTVVEHRLGSLIGKAGSNINAMQRASGAKICVTDQLDDATAERIVQIVGAPEAVDRAQALIEERLNAAAEREAAGVVGRKHSRSADSERRQRRPPKVEVEEASFDADGQLVVVKRRVEVEQYAAAGGAGSNTAASALSTRRPRPVQRFDAPAERARYFRDDDAPRTLAELAAAERRGAGAGAMDETHARHIARSRAYRCPTSVDDEYDYDGGLEEHDGREGRMSEAKRARHQSAQSATLARGVSVAEDRARQRLNDVRHCVVAMGETCYLRVQDRSPIGLGHCIVEPFDLVPSHAAASESLATELRNFQKCLIRMFEGRGAALIFFEQVLRPDAMLSGSMTVECVPLPLGDAEAAPGYFKKAILESEGEWSTHRKLLATRGCVRGVVPPQFAYFDVSFGLRAGFAHVIEDPAGWSPNFGRDVIEGLVEHLESGIPLQRRSRLSRDEVEQRVADFRRAFAPYDWTGGRQASQ